MLVTTPYKSFSALIKIHYGWYYNTFYEKCKQAPGKNQHETDFTVSMYDEIDTLTIFMAMKHFTMLVFTEGAKQP